MLPGCRGGEQSDAVQAYTQAILYHGAKQNVDTWVIIPKDQWPKSWHAKYKDPVVPLRLALYGHPLAGKLYSPSVLPRSLGGMLLRSQRARACAVSLCR